MEHKRLTKLIAMLLVAATLVGLLAVPASAASLANSGSVKITMNGFGNYLSKKSGGTIGGGYWQYTSNDGLTGAAYCVNLGLTGVSPSKSLTIQPYNRNPQTMGAFANGYPARTLEQFKQLHKDDVRGIANLTETEYKYATQVAVWASCGQISVPGTKFTAGRTALVEPTSDARQIRIFDSIKRILGHAELWDKPLYLGMYIHSEENSNIQAVEIIDEHGLEGAASSGKGSIKKETIYGKEYFTRVMYLDSATSTWIDGYKTKLYSPDAPAGTIFVAANNAPLETVVEGGTTYYKVDTSRGHDTNLNANGYAYGGVFKVCIPVDNVANEGSFSIKAAGGVAQYNLYLANNPSSTEQSYIIADPGYTTTAAKASFKWRSSQNTAKASLQIVKTGPGGAPLEGAEFELTGDKGTTVTGTSDLNGQVVWSDLSADEKFTLTETRAPEGYQIVAPQNITLEPGRTTYVTVPNDAEKGFTVKKVDAQNKSSLQGAVFRFEQIDGSYRTTGTTGFDGKISFEGDGLPYGSYRVTEESAPAGYLKDTRVETVEWTGEKDVLLTFENVREAQLIIVKKDAQTGVSLPGAVFDVYGDGKYLTSVTTNEAGEARVTGIKGEMYVEAREKTAPEHYTLDRSSHGIHISPYDPAIEDDPVLTVLNQSKPSLRIIKYDRLSGTKLANVTFEIYKDAELLGEYTTNASGEIFLYDLEPGTYLVKEVATDDAHVVNSTPQQIELGAGETQTRELVFFNSLKPGIHLIKVDSVTMKSLPNVRFEFKLVGGSYRQEFTTDINGEIDLSKLTPGAYEVRELEAPEGYLIDDAVRVVQVNLDENANFVFTNSKKPSLKLTKTSSDGSPLGGVSFRLAKIEDGSHYLDRTTNAAGEILWEGLEPGVYSVKETATVSDHILDLQEYHVELFPGQTSTITIENQKRPNLIVYKKDADTGDPIPDTIFTVRAADGHSVDEIKTDAEGRAELKNLLPGVYEVSEKSVPAPWLMDADPQLVTLYPNRDHTVHFQNHKKPTLTVNKVDSITGSPIKGAKFEVWYGSNDTATGELNSLGTFFSDENGQFFVDLLRDGWYEVTELEPAPGFTIKEPATQEFYLKGGTSKTITFENVPKNAIILEKYDSVTGEALPGCTFQLKYLGGTSGTGGTVIGTKVTGKNGVAMWTGLNPGAYLVEEIDAADGYSIIQSSETIMLADNGEQSVVTVRFKNAPAGILLIRKVCSVNPSVTLQNAEFKVLYADGTVVGDSNGIFRTDENGQIRIEGLKPGKSVVVTETRAPAGFILDTQSQTAQIKEGRTVSLTFKNQPKGAIIIQKRDSATGRPLSGAEFRVTTAAGCEVGLDGVIGTSSLTQNGIFTTDSSGEIKITNLAPGAYVLTELKAPSGYVMDSASTNVVIGQGGDTQTVVVKNSKAGTLVIDKRDSLTGKPLQGVTFKVTTSTGEYVPDASGHISSNGLYFTDKDGKITINGVVGTLVVTETATIPGYTIDEAARTQTVDVRPNDTQALHFTNTPSTTLVIEKYIEGTTTPLKGVTFLVTDSSGAVVGNSNGEYITDENGRIVIEGLEPGITVTAREVKALEGYVLDGQPKSILIKAGEVQTLRFYNQKQGGLVIKKLDSMTKKPLAGVEFQITYADGSYVDADNGHLSSKGLYKTDANGEIRISGVVGTLVVTETRPLPGYVMDEGTRTQTVKVNASDTQTITVYNTKMGGLTIIKTDEETGERISGVQFEIRKLNGEIIGTYTTDRSGVISLPEAEKGWYQVTELKAAKGYQLDSRPYQIEVKDGSTATLEITNRQTGSAIIHKIDSVTGKGIFGVKFLLSDARGNPVGVYESDNEGYVYVDGGLADGKYTVREIECADGYILDTQPKTIYVEYGGCTTVTWKNTPITGQIQVTKTSADYNSMNGWPAGTPIPGTVFEIYHCRTGNLVDTIRTDKNGVAVSKPLPLGRYKVVESKAADFYALDKTPIDVEIEHAGQIVKAAMTNKSLYTNVSIQKTGYAEVMPGQNIRYTFSKIANNSNTALTSYYWRDTLPVEAVRLAKITTGTYNAAGSYKIVYRTNLSGADCRVLADSLNTRQNYVLEASPAALRLASNEYVTEVMFVFGVVPANFTQVEAPKIDCTVVPWARGGSQFVNQADVGGIVAASAVSFAPAQASGLTHSAAAPLPSQAGLGSQSGQWIMAATRWVTKVYAPSKPLPVTGY